MLARRSRRIYGRLLAPHIRMIITCSPHLRWKVCLRQISRTINGIQRAAAEVMIATPTLAAPPTRRLARRRAVVTCVVRTAMTRPTSTVALATTRHSTRREVTGGDRTSGEAGGRRSSGRACMRTRGFRKCAKLIRLEKPVVCRQWRGNPRPGLTQSTLHRSPVGQGPSPPGWLAIALGFWYSGRALATGTAWAGLCLINSA